MFPYDLIIFLAFFHFDHYRKVSRTLENLQGGDIVFTKEELNEVDEVLTAHPVAGERYFGKSVDLHLWG